MIEKQENTILLTEKHDIKLNSSFAQELHSLCFKSKNIYNQAVYQTRQEFFRSGTLYNYETLYCLLKSSDCYRDLPRKVSQQVLKIVAQTFKSFRRATQEYRKCPKKFLGRPKLPKYKDKVKGQFVVPYTIQSISKRELKNNIISLSNTNIKISTRQKNIQQVRIIPHKTHYSIEVVYKKEIKCNKKLKKRKAVAIDLGVNNLLTITSNKIGFIPRIVNGRSVKSVNQFYNKKKAFLQSLLPKNKYSSKRINKLALKRGRKINHYLHHASKFIVKLCTDNNLGTIIIGRNKNWKQNSNMNKQNNQNFVSIPFYKLIEQIHYKALIAGINVVEREESYTSKCSFLDLEPVKKHKKYKGYRKMRGMFKSKKYGEINADVNGSYNILRKAFPGSFKKPKGTEGLVVNPVSYTLCKI